MVGSGALTVMVEFSVGLAPGADGYVLISVRLPRPGGIIDFRPNLMKAFLTGKIPGDWRLRRPRISSSIVCSLVSTRLARLNSYSKLLKL